MTETRSKMDMNNAKTIAVFVIIFGCFAILYPKIFHPIIVHMIWGAPPKPQGDYAPRTGQSPPSVGGTPRPNEAHDMHKFMRGGPHPGMRAAAEMRKQMSPTQGGGGKGMMGFVLPMYAIGIVLYLLYTLSKVFGNKKDEEGKEDIQPSRYDESVDGRESGDGRGSRRGGKRLGEGRLAHRELEELLMKCDDKKISPEELHALRARLEETESQMSRILAAMEAVSQKKQEAPVDSSPDMDTYEIINGEKGGVSPVVEDVGPRQHSDGEDGDDEADDEEHERDDDEEEENEGLEVKEDHFKLPKEARGELDTEGVQGDTIQDHDGSEQPLDETAPKSANQETESLEVQGVEEVVDEVIPRKEESEGEEKPVRRRVKAAKKEEKE